MPSLHLPLLSRVRRSEFQPQAITSSPPVTPGDPSGDDPAEEWPPTRLELWLVRVPRKGPQRGSGGVSKLLLSAGAPPPFQSGPGPLLISGQTKSTGKAGRSSSRSNPRRAWRHRRMPAAAQMSLEAACQIQPRPPNTSCCCAHPSTYPPPPHTSSPPLPASTNTQTYTGNQAGR